MPVNSPLLPVDELVENIYGGLFEDRPWQAFLYQLRQRTGAAFAALSLRTGGVGVPPIVLIDRGYDISKEDALRKANEYAELVAVDPLSSKLSQSGEILNLTDIATEIELAENPFYQVLMKPANMSRYLGMSVYEPSGWTCHLRLMNTPDQDDFDHTDKDLLKAIHPYLEQALGIFAEMKRSQLEIRELRSSLDRLTIGVFVLDASGNILDANEVAKKICQSNSSIFIRNRQLLLNDKHHQAVFSDYLRRAGASFHNPTEDAFVETHCVETSSGGKLDLLVRAVGKVDRYIGATSPAIIVYITDSLERYEVHDELLVKLFDLTPTESRLAGLLALGLTLSEAAESLGITENTVRGYSKKIYSKLGISRQTDLVRLILKSVAMLA